MPWNARNLYAVGVAASERYNARFEDALARRLGVVFVDRPGGAASRRPVREILGVPPALIRHFSRRRAAIEDRLTKLRAAYRAAHGREPSRAVQLQLAQQATLETREGKAPGRTLAEQVADWTAQEGLFEVGFIYESLTSLGYREHLYRTGKRPTELDVVAGTEATLQDPVDADLPDNREDKTR